MNDQQLLRYSRHILLDEISIEGQNRLLDSRVLIVGLGGLGSAAAMYLAASGVGRLILADHDQVDISNLQRQIIHTTASVNQFKVNSAQQRLHELNPEITVDTFAQKANEALLDELVPKVHVVLDCSDNFSTRYVVNQKCVKYKIPLVSGAAIRFEGQITVFNTRSPEAPCYACLFGNDPQDLDNQACATTGVFAPLVGIIGAMQAAETLKLLIGNLPGLSNKLLQFDARRMIWKTIDCGLKQPDCVVCGLGKLTLSPNPSSEDGRRAPK